jgi:hypothetical protein
MVHSAPYSVNIAVKKLTRILTDLAKSVNKKNDGFKKLALWTAPQK